MLLDLSGCLLLDSLWSGFGLILHLALLDLSFDEVIFVEVALVIVAGALSLLFFALLVRVDNFPLWLGKLLDLLLWSRRRWLLFLLLLRLYKSGFGLSSWGGLLGGLFLRGLLLSDWLRSNLLDWLLLNGNDWSFLFSLGFLLLFFLYLGFQFSDFSINFSLSFLLGLDLGLGRLVSVLLRFFGWNFISRTA